MTLLVQIGIDMTLRVQIGGHLDPKCHINTLEPQIKFGGGGGGGGGSTEEGR